MGDVKIASAGAQGGSAAERGAELRARVGALLATAVLRGESLRAIELAAPASAAVGLEVEGDEPVDDLIVHLEDGARVFLQVKLAVGLTRTRGSPLDKAVAQFARAVREGLDPGDRLVLASAEPVKALLDLGRRAERDRLPIVENPSPAEDRATERFMAIARSHASQDEVDAILRHLVVWQTNPMSGDGAAALTMRLEGPIVRVGEGARGIRELADIVRGLARLRGGLDSMRLAQELQARGVELSPSAPAASPVAWAGALAAYRELAVRRGSTLQLLGVAGALDNVPFDEADSDIEVDVPEDERSIGREFALALRRRGRVLAVGAPGGGKSTALRATAAHWARRRDWPTPVLIHLQRLASAEAGLTETVLQIATEDAVGPARPALRGALEHELERGRLLLLLDGLDEVRTGQKVLVQQLAAWMKELPASTEVVVALRPVAASNAEQLGFPTLVLRPPHRPERTIDALLEAAAAAHTEADDWVSVRRKWVEDAIERDPALGSTPLSVVVLCLIAIRSDDPEALPSTRATILKRALQDILEDWEVEHRRRGKVTIGTLEGGLATRALRDALQVLSEAAIREEPATAAEASRLVSECLSRRYPVAGAAAEETADQATAFWVDTGLFAFTDGRVAATIRPFAEVATAWTAADSERADQDRWLDAARTAADRWPAVALAAGLSWRIAEQWTELLAQSGPAEEFLALSGAIRDGVRVDPTTLARAVNSAADRHLSMPEHAEETAVAIIELPLSAHLRARVRPLLSRQVAPERKALVETLATVEWGELGTDADERLRGFVRAPPPPNPMRRLSPPVDYLLPLPDTRYHSAFEAAMIRLATTSRADAELVIESFDDGSMEFREELRRVLTAAGHQDLADRVNRDLESAAAQARSLMSSEEFDATERRLLGWAAALAAPASLAQIQQRRVDDLADLWATAALHWAHPKWVAKWPELAREWLCIAAHLSGFNLSVIAAEAQAVLDDMDAGDETDRLIFDAGQAREPTLWERVQRPSEALAALVCGIGSPHELARAIARAIVHAPQELQADLLLERRMKEVRNWSRWFAARLAILCAPDSDARATGWTRDEDPLLRAAAAEWWSFRVGSGSVREADLVRCFTDSDEGVRDAALTMLAQGEISGALVAALVQLGAAQRQEWQCRFCGAANPAGGRSSCVECSRSGPDVASQVERLLAAGPS